MYLLLSLIAIILHLQYNCNMSTSSFRDICSIHDIRFTRVRSELYDLLISHSPVAAREFIAHATNQGFDTVSVYRSLDLFEKIGICDSYGSGKNRVLYASNDGEQHHHFIRCTNCNRAFEFENEAIEMQLDAIARRAGFADISSHYLEISGICKYCNQFSRTA